MTFVNLRLAASTAAIVLAVLTPPAGVFAQGAASAPVAPAQQGTTPKREDAEFRYKGVTLVPGGFIEAAALFLATEIVHHQNVLQGRQRGANRQPGARSRRLGGWPEIKSGSWLARSLGTLASSFWL